MITRREFGKLTLAGLTVPRLVAAEDSTVNTVRLGAQTYSFRALPRTPAGDAIDPIIKAMTECGLSECELYAPQVEPAPAARPGRRAAPASADAAKARDDL